MKTILPPVRRRNLRRIDAARAELVAELGTSLALALAALVIYAAALLLL